MSISRKLFISVLFSFVGALFLAAIPAQASHDDNGKDSGKPRISQPTGVGSSSVVLSIRHKDRKKDEVAVRVRIEDRRTGMIIWREFRTKLNSDGRAEIVVDNLNPNTTYALRADVRKITLNRFSRNSDTVMVTTSGQAVQQQEAQ